MDVVRTVNDSNLILPAGDVRIGPIDYKADVMADLSASCRKRGLKFGVYVSPADRHFGVGVGGKADDSEIRRVLD